VGRLLALTTNLVTNTLAYYSLMTTKKFITLVPGSEEASQSCPTVDVKKLFFFVTAMRQNELECLSLPRIFTLV
jgi:hypothetical protein